MSISFDDYIKKFNKIMANYIPEKKNWTPADYAVYGPKDMFKEPIKKAKELQFNAIKYQFKRHFELNKMYNGFCKEKKFTPEKLKTYNDLEKIPLIPGEFYKQYPAGKDFALWLANIFTGKIPEIKISGPNPSFDDVINSFNSTGLEVAYSSGTSGRHTFIPRDERSFKCSEYALGKNAVSMTYPLWDHSMNGYLLMPNPHKTQVFAGRVCLLYFDLLSNIQTAIDKVINTETIRLSMIGATQGGLKAKIIKKTVSRMYKNIVNNIIKWLEKQEKENNSIVFGGAPFILFAVTNKLKEQGKSFDFADKGAILTGGGWKVQEDSRVPAEDFRKQMQEFLGIKPEHCLDIYGMVEGNGWNIHCPEGHYLHIPYTYYHPLVLDDEFKPVGYNEYGLFAFLDGSTYSYPGFIISGDRVKMLEHCPVCDRPGPVLEPEVTRAKGKEMRGCAEEVRKMITTDIGG